MMDQMTTSLKIFHLTTRLISKDFTRSVIAKKEKYEQHQTMSVFIAVEKQTETWCCEQHSRKRFSCLHIFSPDDDFFRSLRSGYENIKIL